MNDVVDVFINMYDSGVPVDHIIDLIEKHLYIMKEDYENLKKEDLKQIEKLESYLNFLKNKTNERKLY